MPPIRNAVRFVDNKESDAVLNSRQHLTAKPCVCKTFWRNQQDIAFVPRECRARFPPFVTVLAVNRQRPETDVERRVDLVAHEREQRADQQCRSGATITQHFGRDKVDDALTPTTALNNQHSQLKDSSHTNRFPLAFAKGFILPKHLA